MYFWGGKGRLSSSRRVADSAARRRPRAVSTTTTAVHHAPHGARCTVHGARCTRHLAFRPAQWHGSKWQHLGSNHTLRLDLDPPIHNQSRLSERGMLATDPDLMVSIVPFNLCRGKRSRVNRASKSLLMATRRAEASDQ